jgi:hypothetical protein
MRRGVFAFSAPALLEFSIVLSEFAKTEKNTELFG